MEQIVKKVHQTSCPRTVNKLLANGWVLLTSHVYEINERHQGTSFTLGKPEGVAYEVDEARRDAKQERRAA